jgi:hypothetical protein
MLRLLRHWGIIFTKLLATLSDAVGQMLTDVDRILPLVKSLSLQKYESRFEALKLYATGIL